MKEKEKLFTQAERLVASAEASARSDAELRLFKAVEGALSLVHTLSDENVELQKQIRQMGIEFEGLRQRYEELQRLSERRE